MQQIPLAPRATNPTGVPGDPTQFADVVIGPQSNPWARAFHRTSVARYTRCLRPLLLVVDLREALLDALVGVEHVVDEAL